MKATKIALLLAALALPLAAAQTALAALTPAGTEITNEATLAYKVGGFVQPTSTSTQTKFNVDRKVNFNVTNVPASFIDVLPGSTDQALKFTVTNQGNDTQDFDLTVAQLTGGTVFGATDNIDAAGVRLYLDNGSVAGSFDSGDTDITAGHLLDEVAQDATVTVFIVGNFPTPQINANVAGLTLAATALHGHGAGAGAVIDGAVTDINGTVPGNAIFTVFADTGRDNSELVAGAFRITAPVLTVNKLSRVIWDPVNFNATPRSIPGSYVQYEITIANAGTALASANLTTIQDLLNGNTVLDPDLVGNALDTAAPTAISAAGKSFMVGYAKTTPGVGRTVASPSYYSAGSGVTVTGQNLVFEFETLLPEQLPDYLAGELKPGESVTLTFNVAIK
ncbi:MAG: hypothetical protein A2075_01160 [Geobacteraceae bacterium GWC2_58_44]|nr:MAG: hypothetical protein A2075_01160 [Geobacteraceae bacterium GWC2_58_44]HBG04141.1 hypothetical protein [Geobacter sp.]